MAVNRGSDQAVKRVVVATIFPESFGGGVGTVAHELANHLAERCEVMLLCPGERTELTTRGNGMKVLTVASAGPDQVYYPALHHVVYDQAVAWLDEFRPDIVHSHDPVMLGAVAQYYALRHRTPFVTTLHWLPDRILEFGAGERSVFKARWLVRPAVHSYISRFLRDCDGIIAINNSVIHGLRGYRVRARVFRIPNGRDLARFRSCPVADMDSSIRNLCFIGFLSQRKNQLYLLQALEHLPANYRLVLAGKALAPDYERELRSYASEHGLNVEFLGQQAQSAVPSCLARCHAFVSASRLEVQSLTVIEALASGTPVIGLANETIDELVDAAVGRCLPRDAAPEEFARAVEQVCSLPQAEYDRLCRQARERVAHMDWNKVVDATAAAYEQMVSGYNPQARLTAAPVKVHGLNPLTYVYGHLNMTGSVLFYEAFRHWAETKSPGHLHK
jgi:1,2-diacylglycerol 3-alpha-glucosyltransferase